MNFGIYGSVEMLLGRYWMERPLDLRLILFVLRYWEARTTNNAWLDVWIEVRLSSDVLQVGY